MRALLELFSFLLSGSAFMYYGGISYDTHGMIFMGFISAFLLYRLEKELKKIKEGAK